MVAEGRTDTPARQLTALLVAGNRRVRAVGHRSLRSAFQAGQIALALVLFTLSPHFMEPLITDPAGIRLVLIAGGSYLLAHGNDRLAHMLVGTPFSGN